MMVAQRVTKTAKGVRKYASQTQRLGKLSNVYCCSGADLLRSHQMIVPCSKAVPSFVRVMLSPAGPGASSAGSSSQPSWSVMQRAFGHLLSGDEVPLGPTACLPSGCPCCYSTQHLEVGQEEGPAGRGWDARSPQAFTVQPYVF